ncbi:MAG: hypothetical protein ACE5IK_08725 [Acidobacteriota bacterium]
MVNPLLIEDPFWTADKIVSGLIALIYVVALGLVEGSGTALKAIAALLLPLGSIWFSEELAGYTGPIIAYRTGMVDRESHPGCLYLTGWLVLLLPILAVFVILLWNAIVALGSLLGL